MVKLLYRETQFMKKTALLFVFSFALVIVNAQESFREKFLEANTLMEENQYNIALPIWMDLQKEQPKNSNINYKIGVCYIHSANNKVKALDYLIKAASNISSNYDPFSYSEKKSPAASYFYLARAYHINYDLDAAILNYNSFKDQVSKKHFLYKQVDHNIQQCENAKEAIKTPVNVKVNNLGIVINSQFADYSPVLSVDESSIYFTSRRVRRDSSNFYIKDINDGQNYEDIYVSNNYDGEWTDPELLNINTEGHEATLNLSVDGQTLFIFKDDEGDGNIYISKLEGEDWSTPIKLGSDINLESRETHAHSSPNGNILYYVSDRKGGKGGQDIYMCKRLPNGEWAKSKNIGDVINTPYDEDGVFIHPDGKTIYFSSKGHKSIGGYDIFSSQMNDDGTWTKPVNLGYPINSTDDDVFFVTSADGKRGYYSSFQEKGFGEKDIYVISLEDENAKPVTLLSGYVKVIGENQTPENAQVVVTNNETGDLVGIYKPRKKDGKFSIILTPGNDYHIVYSAASYKQEEDLYVPPISAYQEISRGIELQEVIFGDSTNIKTEEPLNYQEGDKLKKLKIEVSQLANLIENDKTTFSKVNPEMEKIKLELSQLETLISTDNSSLPANKKKLNDLEKKINALKVEMSTLNPTKKEPIISNTNTLSPTETKQPTTSNKVVANHQVFFKYNVKSINTSDKLYMEMINKAVAKINKGEKIIIDIVSSASKVPTKSFKSNSELAYKRAIEAKKTIINSLTKKGVDKKKVVFRNIDSGVNGPKYGGKNKRSTYEKHQYVIIKII